MIEERYVTFDTAKLLFRNGFNVPCRCYYLKDGIRREHCRQEPSTKGAVVYECPTQAVAMEWLREACSIAVVPIPHRYPGLWTVIIVYLGEPMEKDDKYDICQLRKDHPSHEDAAEYGIRFAVKEIVAGIRRQLKNMIKN